jgi:hypothetical protein
MYNYIKSNFNFFFFFFLNLNKGKGYKGGSLPLRIRMEERMGDPMGMLPNTWLEAAHLANTCARKFAHLETFEAYQL